MPDSAVDPRAEQTERWRIPGLAHGIVGLVIAGVTCASLRFFYTHGLSNLYGDGLAHMEGARRIFDSTTPGYEEIGSVWLPLYHLICAPLAQNDFLWRTGLAGGIVSSIAFALTAYLLFRLAAELNQNVSAGLLALAGVLLCPSLLYLASTPLTEPLALLWAVLVVYALFRYAQSGSWKALVGAALAAFAGTLTRYEGWNILPFAVLLVFFLRPLSWRERLVRTSCLRHRRFGPVILVDSQRASVWQSAGVLQWTWLGEGYLCSSTRDDGIRVPYRRKSASFSSLLR